MLRMDNYKIVEVKVI